MMDRYSTVFCTQYSWLTTSQESVLLWSKSRVWGDTALTKYKHKYKYIYVYINIYLKVY